MSRIDYVTPTQLAEEAYAASQRRKQPMGPAGLPVPSPKAVYSKTLDGKLLIAISKAAFAAYEARELPPEREAEVAAILRADLISRFPQADMAVLDRYGMAEPWKGVFVQIITTPVSGGRTVVLPEPVLLPRRNDRQFSHHSFHVDLGGQESSTAQPVPVTAESFFRVVREVQRAWKHEFDPAYHWCSMFRPEKGRWPRWHEIERQFPRVGEWLNEQRAGLNRSKAA